PVITSTALSRPSAKNASALLSGDQNGCDAPSVPARERGTAEFNGRSQSDSEPLVSTATNASWRPSGESASMPPEEERSHGSDADAVSSTAGAVLTEGFGAHAVQTIAATTTSDAIAAHRRTRSLRLTGIETAIASVGTRAVAADTFVTAAIKR